MERVPLKIGCSAFALLCFGAAAAAPAEDVRFGGTCDGSAGVAVGHDQLLVANDEDNALRLYPISGADAPLQVHPLDAFLGVTLDKPEADIEAAAPMDGRVYWMTSHGRNKKGKARPNRHRFFATEIELTDEGSTVVRPVGKPYARLLDDLLAPDSHVERTLALSGHRTLPPKRGGINIEGLAATPQGDLWIGLRSPVFAGEGPSAGTPRALLVRLRNPAAVVAGEARADLGDAVLIELGGRGVRSLAYRASTGSILIVAGPPGSHGSFALYEWGGEGTGARLLAELESGQDASPEALVAAGAPGRILLLVDEGSRPVDGVECKEAPEGRRSFGGRWLERGDSGGS